jgi:hypothetical protein
MNNAELALQEWLKTQSLPVSDVEEHGFINGYNWALNEKRPNNAVLVPCDKLAEMQNRIAELEKYLGFKNSGYDIISANVTLAKTLTDEEIDKLWHSDEFYEEWTDGSISAIHYNKFAKAILRKAQGK